MSEPVAWLVSAVVAGACGAGAADVLASSACLHD